MGAVPVMGLLQYEAGQSEASAIRSQAAFQRQQLEFNKKLANISAEDAIDRGEEAVVDYKKQAEKVKGAQTAALAAQGIDIGAGTAAQIEYTTEKQVQTDVSRIRNNAWREAWGYKVEASNLEMQSMMVGLESKARARSARFAGAVGGAQTIIGGLKSAAMAGG